MIRRHFISNKRADTYKNILVSQLIPVFSLQTVNLRIFFCFWQKYTNVAALTLTSCASRVIQFQSPAQLRDLRIGSSWKTNICSSSGNKNCSSVAETVDDHQPTTCKQE